MSFFIRLKLSKDEINQIDISPCGKYLAAGDDSGEVMLTNIDANSSHLCFSGVHDNICSSVVFSSWSDAELISGGLDCQIVGWDYELKEAIWHRRMESEPGSQICNPPMVHCVATPLLDPEHEKWPGLSAAARGDGSIWVGFGQGFCGDSEDDPDLGDSNKSVDGSLGEFGQMCKQR